MGNITIDVSEPSIGQVEYLKYLQLMSTVQKPSFIVVEMELPSYDPEVIRKTVTFFLSRHNSLRTVFPVINNKIVQVVQPVDDERFDIAYVTMRKDIHGFSKMRKDCFDKASASFSDIGNGPLIRVIVFENGRSGLLSLLIHHVICDEWSSILIRNELKMIYESYAAGSIPDLCPVHVQLKDYCERQNTWLRQHQEEISFFWKQKLDGFHTFFDMTGFRKMYNRRKNVLFPGLNRSRVYNTAELGAILDRPEASSYTAVLPRSLLGQVKKTGIGNSLASFSVVYTWLFLFLYAYTGKKKLLMPGLVTDRFDPEHQSLIGCLLGSIYLTVDIKEQMTVQAFAQEIERELAISCKYIIFSHSFLELDGDRIRNCCDMYINYLRKEGDIPVKSYKMGHVEEDYAINYPVYCMITEYDDALAFVWKYNRFLFEEKMIEDMVTYFEMLVKYIISNEDLLIGDLKNLVSVPEVTL